MQSKRGWRVWLSIQMVLFSLQTSIIYFLNTLITGTSLTVNSLAFLVKKVKLFLLVTHNLTSFLFNYVALLYLTCACFFRAWYFCLVSPDAQVTHMLVII